MLPLPIHSGLEDYRKQAENLLNGWNTGEPEAVRVFRERHPRFLDSQIPWLPKKLSEEELRSATLDLADAELAVARWYDFEDWSRLAAWVEAVTEPGSPVARFEAAVDAVIEGDLARLQRLLAEGPELSRARSTRGSHRATLLHYVAANGVEGHRQKSPANAVAVAKMLLDAGAEPDALANMYGGEHTTMSMLVSSAPPREAGVEVPLIDLLVDYGAAVEGRGRDLWAPPLMTALAFGHADAAEALVRRGARVNTLAAAAGLGRLDEAVRLLPGSDGLERHRALALAAQHGHADIVGLLLDAGEDPSRYNPEGNHGHSTPLHQAVLAGHDDVVRLLVERGARLDIRDTAYQATPLGWAEYGGRKQLAEYLRGRGATE